MASDCLIPMSVDSRNASEENPIYFYCIATKNLGTSHSLHKITRDRTLSRHQGITDDSIFGILVTHSSLNYKTKTKLRHAF